MAARKKTKNRDGNVMNDDKNDEGSYYKTTIHVAIQCDEFYLKILKFTHLMSAFFNY